MTPKIGSFDGDERNETIVKLAGRAQVASFECK